MGEIQIFIDSLGQYFPILIPALFLALPIIFIVGITAHAKLKRYEKYLQQQKNDLVNRPVFISRPPLDHDDTEPINIQAVQKQLSKQEHKKETDRLLAQETPAQTMQRMRKMYASR